MESQRVCVICPLRDATSDKWTEVENALKSFPTVNKYYTFYPASSYHLHLHKIAGNKSVTPEQWEAILASKSDELNKVNILLTERCQITPRPALTNVFVQERAGFTFLLDGADTTLTKTVRNMAAAITNTHFDPDVNLTMEVGYLNSLPPNKDSDDYKTFQEECQSLFTRMKELFEGNKAMIPFDSAVLVRFDTYSSWSKIALKSPENNSNGGENSQPSS